MKNSPILIGIISLVIGAAAGFYGGTQYQQSKKTTFLNGAQPGSGQFAMRGDGSGTLRGDSIKGGFKPVNGEIIAVDDKSITVRLEDGSSKIVLTSGKTQINRAEKVDKKELTEGVKVAVFGTENSDGSVTAQNIQMNPTLRMIEEK